MALARQPGPVARPVTPRRVAPTKVDTREFRRWEGVNVRDSRTGIGDTEFAWLQNFIPVGTASLQMLHAPAAPVATYAPGLGRMWGFTLNDDPYLIAIGLDGSIQQYTPSGTHTQIAPPGSVTKFAWATIWQADRVLFIDPEKGYSSWNLTAWTLHDATLKGTSIAVFEGRVWIANKRTIIWSAPNEYDNFAVADGGGFSTLTDSAFQGNIQMLISALQSLWIFGQSAIDAISNVVSVGDPPLVVTSFSTTNIVSNIGTTAPSSVQSYFRALLFGSAFGVHALSGVTPQKISEKLDGFSRELILTAPYFDIPGAVAVLEDNLVALFLAKYIGREAQGVTACPVPLLLCFLQGKWFFATQGNQLEWITTLVAATGVHQAWGHTGTAIFQLFGADDCAMVPYKLQGKLYDFGSAVTEKALMKLGVEMRATVRPQCACQDILALEGAP